MNHRVIKNSHGNSPGSFDDPDSSRHVDLFPESWTLPQHESNMTPTPHQPYIYGSEVPQYTFPRHDASLGAFPAPSPGYYYQENNFQGWPQYIYPGQRGQLGQPWQLGQPRSYETFHSAAQVFEPVMQRPLQGAQGFEPGHERRVDYGSGSVIYNHNNIQQGYELTRERTGMGMMMPGRSDTDINLNAVPVNPMPPHRYMLGWGRPRSVTANQGSSPSVTTHGNESFPSSSRTRRHNIQPTGAQPSMDDSFVNWDSRPGSSRTRRMTRPRGAKKKLTEEDKARNRAFKRVGGVCPVCKRTKKRCEHRDLGNLVEEELANQNQSFNSRTRLASSKTGSQPRARSHGSSSFVPQTHSERSVFSSSHGTASNASEATSVANDFNNDNNIRRNRGREFGPETAAMGDQFVGGLLPRFTPPYIMDADADIDINDDPTDQVTPTG